MRLERDVIFWTAVLIVFVGLLWLLSPILLPFVVGMAIAYMLDPLTTRLTRRGLSRLVAALVILAGFVVVAIGLSLLVVPVLVGVPEISPLAVFTLKPVGSGLALKLVGLLVAVI